MSIVDYSVLRNEDYGTNPPFKSDEVEPIQRNFLSNFIIKIINQACRRTYSKHQVSEYARR